MHYIKVYSTAVLKNGFVYIETSDANLLNKLRSDPLTKLTDFHLKFTQDILRIHIALFLYHYAQCLRP